MAETLFIADLHLQPSQPAVLRAFYEFLKTEARDAEALYLLGDLTEAWVGDDDDADWLVELADALTATSHRGTRLYFLHGNRDFLLGDDFARRCGITLLPEQLTIDLYGRPTLLMHGDTLCTADVDYLQLRQQLRNPAWQQALLAKSLPERRQIAAMLRQESQKAGGLKADEIMDVTPAEVARVMADHGVDLLIHGHTHRPARHALTVDGQPAERIVLGDWGPERWWLRAGADGSLTLEYDAISA